MLPGYSPDFNPDEAIWNWIREDVTANTCFGTAAKVREKVDAFFSGLTERTGEVRQRWRRKPHAEPDAVVEAASRLFARIQHVDLALRLV